MEDQLLQSNPLHLKKIAGELKISENQVQATLLLLDNGATIPFIARYRKEMTGSLDEVYIAKIRDRITQLRELDKRRESILNSIKEQGKLTDELEEKINQAETMSVLEDIYLPYKPKRRTKATIAKEKGLEPLAELVFQQEKNDLSSEASKYIDIEKGVNTTEEALAGARDVIAEWINENQDSRNKIRHLFLEKGTFKSKVIAGKEEEAQKYKDYFDWEESLKDAPSHRVLAIRRAEAEMFLSLDIAPEEEEALDILGRLFIKAKNESAQQVEIAMKDAYKRLLKSSMETEIRLLSKKKADEEAIRVFAENIKELLLAAPLGQKNILAIDPGFRTGCKVVCLDRQGKLLINDVIYPDRRATEASITIQKFVEQFEVEAIAIGNGTASRETETFIKSIGLPPHVSVVMVNESGASVYSASDVAREEFPDFDITVRGAVSIGRRLADPLAELVKIDPKAIGVGQYQHDVDQHLLKNSLDDVVMSCVNAVGVEINTASKQILTYISGLGPQLAQNIVEYRNKNGAFRSREELKKVPRLGDKAFEQAAGFLRIRNAEYPLDMSAVHPESYAIVEQMAKDLQCTVLDLMKNEPLRKQINLKSYMTEQIGLPTLNDIVAELAKPGRDPREQFEVFEFAEGIKDIQDLKIGMTLNGIITNVTNFGAFVDLGIHHNGLIHISNMSDKFISNPSEIVKVQQKVQVTVLEIDMQRKRIALSLIGNTQQSKPKTEVQKEKTEIAKQVIKKPEVKKEKFVPKKVENAKPTPKTKKPEKEDVPLTDFQLKLEELKNKFK